MKLSPLEKANELYHQHIVMYRGMMLSTMMARKSSIITCEAIKKVVNLNKDIWCEEKMMTISTESYWNYVIEHLKNPETNFYK